MLSHGSTEVASCELLDCCTSSFKAACGNLGMISAQHQRSRDNACGTWIKQSGLPRLRLRQLPRAHLTLCDANITCPIENPQGTVLDPFGTKISAVVISIPTCLFSLRVTTYHQHNTIYGVEFCHSYCQYQANYLHIYSYAPSARMALLYST